MGGQGRKATHWGGWWCRGVWRRGLRCWGRRRAGAPPSCRCARCRRRRTRTRGRSACWCCSGRDSHCRKWRSSGGRRSSPAGWTHLSWSGSSRCYLQMISITVQSEETYTSLLNPVKQTRSDVTNENLNLRHLQSKHILTYLPANF